MPNRRDFVLQAAAAGALAFTESRAAPTNTTPSSSKPMRVLILGGTGFIGPHFVGTAVNRGHTVSVFSRGEAHANLPRSVERLSGDRNGNLESLKGREWDAVFDLATYVPNWVRTLCEALEGRVKHYTFISSILAYKFPGATDENSELLSYTDRSDPYSLTSPGDQYGPLKVLCEREAEKGFLRKTLVLRPGHIVGPRERWGLLTYWIARMEKGGEVLAGGDPLTQVQLIDARDLAEWAIRMAEQGTTGAYNAVGPAMSLGWGEMLGAIRGAVAAPMKLTWVPMPWLMERHIGPSSSLLLWPSEMGIPGLTRLKNDKAVASGLTFRPLHMTIAGTLAWYKDLSKEEQRGALLGFDQNNKTLEDSMAREAECLAAWHAQKSHQQG